jgi:hypothetical protein
VGRDRGRTAAAGCQEDDDGGEALHGRFVRAALLEVLRDVARNVETRGADRGTRRLCAPGAPTTPPPQLPLPGREATERTGVDGTGVRICDALLDARPADLHTWTVSHGFVFTTTE